LKGKLEVSWEVSNPQKGRGGEEADILGFGGARDLDGDKVASSTG